MVDYAIGPDLSRHRAGFDLAKIKASGGSFVITKATEINANGVQWWQDTAYADYRDQAKAVQDGVPESFPFGAFLYWKCEEDPEEQVDWYFEVVKKHIDLPPILDVERVNNVNSTGAPLRPVAENIENIEFCAQLLHSIYKVPPILYTNANSWKVMTGNSDLLHSMDLWVASWTTYWLPTLPQPAEDWEWWQFTSAYPWPGQPKTADATRYNGTEAQLREYVKVVRSLMYPEAPPPPDPVPPPVGEPLEIVVNGKRYRWYAEAVPDA